MSGKLYLVATPIGNLGDFPQRAIETLENSDFIAAEDTRVSMKLLNHFGIKKTLVSYHEHNRRDAGPKIVQRILSGETCSLVTDAGMPAVSDPGEELVALCAESGIQVLAVPGACSAVCALALSGLPTGRFTFEGFLSMTRKNRAEHLASLRDETRTMVFLEAPHKLCATLSDLVEEFGGDRRCALCREMTKLHEETMRTTLKDAAAYFKDNPPRGEFVLVIEGAKKQEKAPADMSQALKAVSEYRDGGYSLKDAARRVSEETGISRKALYDAAIGK